MGRISKSAALFISLFIVIGLFLSCSDDPTGTAPDPEHGSVDPSGDRDFFLGSATIDGVPDGRIDVWAYNLTVSSDSSQHTVVAFDVVLVNRSRSTVFPPVLFFITKIVPRSVSVLNGEIVNHQHWPGFDFSDDLGADNRLEPDEHSAPVTMQFAMEALASFVIGFEVTAGSPPVDPDISGVVFLDSDQNGERDNTESGIPSVQVHLIPKFINVWGGPTPRATETDSEGRYGFGGLQMGPYEIRAFGPGRMTSPNPLLVTLVGDSSGVKPIDGVDFGFFAPDSSAVFGPVSVGPGSGNGTRLERSFPPPDPQADDYVLHVVPPMILTNVFMVVDVARVWLNGELIYEFVCHDRTGVTCLPIARVGIPPHLLREEPNHIQILVEGSAYTALEFSIRPASGWPNG